jgi:hypothetical protein
MYYEINIAQIQGVTPKEWYRHLFATAPRSIQTKEKLEQVYGLLLIAFPFPQYEISITQHHQESVCISTSNFEQINPNSEDYGIHGVQGVEE